jgi:hypothetical protein
MRAWLAWLDSLPDLLDYTGEFGPELVLFVPFCRWLSNVGLMKKRRIRTYFGMHCFYDDLACLEIIDKNELRRYVPPEKRPVWLPIKNEHNFDNLGWSPMHVYPDLRSRFRTFPLIPQINSADRPLLVIHNKYCNEWEVGPVNFIPLSILDTIFNSLKHDFTIVYVRHDAGEPGYSEDHNTLISFNDGPLLCRHPEVLRFSDLYASHLRLGGSQDLNTFKNVLYSRCYRFISSQGGGAHHVAFFSGSLLVILHRRGSEESWAYGDGYYNFVAPVSPIRAICRTHEDLVRAVPLFMNSHLIDNQMQVAKRSHRLLSELSPWTIA